MQLVAARDATGLQRRGLGGRKLAESQVAKRMHVLCRCTQCSRRWTAECPALLSTLDRRVCRLHSLWLLHYTHAWSHGHTQPHAEACQRHSGHAPPARFGWQGPAAALTSSNVEQLAAHGWLVWCHWPLMCRQPCHLHERGKQREESLLVSHALPWGCCGGSSTQAAAA